MRLAFSSALSLCRSLSITLLRQRFTQLILLFYRYNNYNQSTEHLLHFPYHGNTFYCENSHSLYTYKCSHFSNKTPYIITWLLTISSCSQCLSIYDQCVSPSYYPSRFFFLFRFLYTFVSRIPCLNLQNKENIHKKTHTQFVFSTLLSLCVLIPLLFLLCIFSLFIRFRTHTSH